MAETKKTPETKKPGTPPPMPPKEPPKAPAVEDVKPPAPATKPLEKKPPAEKGAEEKAPDLKVVNGGESTPSQSPPKKKQVITQPKTDKPPKVETKPLEKKPPMPPEDTKQKKGPSAEKPEPTEPEPEVASTKALFSNKPKKFAYLDSSELHDFHTFRKHPYQVKDNAEMLALVEKVKRGGVREPVLVRPQPEGGYEILSGHRRRRANDLAEGGKLPCIIVEMNDQEAVRAMAEGNAHREKRLPSELARLLDLEVEAIKRQGARGGDGQRSTEVVGKEYSMTGKQVQRYIDLLKLEPKLLDMVDEGRIGISSAYEIAHISKKNQKIILDTIESLQSTPSVSQVQRMKKLDDKGRGILNADMIEGIMSEEKKEEIKVVITSQELSKYFGPDKTPAQMKAEILRVMDENLPKLPEKTQPDKNAR
jgi:ParB/RepB/Spo0J family partition protein